MEYYIQRHESGTVGNCILFWKKGNRGYACDLNEARVFSQEEKDSLMEDDQGEKFTAWEKPHLDKIAERHIHCETI